MNILQNNNEFFSSIPKAKTAKIVRNILNIVASVPDSIDVQISLCKDIIKWCEVEKRTFLRQRIDGKLAGLYLVKKESNDALKVIYKLLTELKKLDDKQMLTEVHLIESRIYHSLQNVPKSKASLTASRSAANAIYVVPLLQAELDEMGGIYLFLSISLSISIYLFLSIYLFIYILNYHSIYIGILHCEEADYSTSYSYFLEAYEAYDANNHSNAVKCLQYMILCKILSNKSAEVPGILSGKFGMKYAGGELAAMSSLAKAAKDRSLEAFTTAVDDHGKYLKCDDLISHHLDKLYSSMLEGNLLKIIYPYSSVEISHVAHRINLPIVSYLTIILTI
jgi:26S proteasome regulatory subunit N6